MSTKITMPFTIDKVRSLKAGDNVEITGTLFVARDAAHKRLCDLIEKGDPLPADFTDSIIFYAGPAPAKPGRPLGPVGPTTSYRMDPYAPMMIEHGVRGMIGKGSRSTEVIEAIKKYGAVYFGAIGGCASLLAKCVESAEIIAYEELGTEALRKITVKDFPVTVIIDCEGNNLYETGRENYLSSLK